MFENHEYSVGFVFLVWFVLNVVATRRVFSYFKYDKSRIALNLILTWLIPFFWALFMLVLTAKASKRKRKDGYKYMESGYKNYTRYM